MKKKPKKKVVKRKTVTAPQAQAIRNLADQLGKLIALEGFRSSFSLTTVAKKRGLSRYLPKKIYKQEGGVFRVFKKSLLPQATHYKDSSARDFTNCNRKETCEG